MGASVLLILGTVSAELAATSEDECHVAGGKWVEIALVDEGTNGMTMDLVKVDSQEVLSSVSISEGTLEESFCLDYWNEDYAPCYDIVTYSDGDYLEDLSWT